jgi:Ca-activated chloride channel family protein
MIVGIIMAIADPIVYQKSQSMKQESLDIVLAVDTSGSMSMYGFNPDSYEQTRLEVVKEVVGSFIAQRKNDRIGLVVFGTQSTIASPLSFDTQAQTSIIKGLEIGTLGKSTALVDAIISSVKLLKESQSPSKVLILLSDGEDSSSITPLPIALKLAKKYGIRIYTIIIDKTHSNMMKLIAKANHTQAYNPKDKSTLEKVYAEINRLEKAEVSYATILVPQHFYIYFLFLALFSALALWFLQKNREVL